MLVFRCNLQSLLQFLGSLCVITGVKVSRRVEQVDPDGDAPLRYELLEGPVRELQLARLAGVRQRLGSGGAAERAAAIAEEMARGAGGA